MKDEKVLFVAWCTSGRIQKVCKNAEEAAQYKQSLLDDGIEIKASETFPAQCAVVDYHHNIQNTTVH
jgi:hypothetical protein